MKKVLSIIALAAICLTGVYASTPKHSATPVDSVVRVKRNKKGVIVKRKVKVDTSKKAKMYHY
jgi:hypothetical protein